MCGKLSLAMKPLKRYFNPAFLHSFALKILCEPRTHREKADLSVNPSFGVIANGYKHSQGT